jgi:cell division protein FtsW (lipid II flippase)
MRHLRLDPTLVIAVLSLAILGTVMVFSASAVRADTEHGGDGYYYFKWLPGQPFLMEYGKRA